MRPSLRLLLSISSFLCTAGFISGCGATPVDDPKPPPSSSKIARLVVIVQENHTFDDHFGNYCRAPAGSNPVCTDGPACCEAPPMHDLGSTSSPTVLTDSEMAAFDPDHSQACEIDEIDGGKMDRFVTSKVCGNPRNFAVAPPSLVMPYLQYAAKYAIADRYFQPIAGQSSSNDMYLARAGYLFTDNAFGPGGITGRCSVQPNVKVFDVPSIGDLLASAGVGWAWYGEGYQSMVDSIHNDDRCPDPPDACNAHSVLYPCSYEAGDCPFQYFSSFRDNPKYIRDLSTFAADVAAGTLPAVTFVKGLGFRTEHPGQRTTLSDGVSFASGIADLVMGSRLGNETLVLITYDEGGGYFDHVPPPPDSAADKKPYGTRVPLMALGPFAKKNHVSHTVMEHSSIVKFIEWNWLNRKTGQLATRDDVVNNLGSLLDPAATGIAVPE